MEDILLVLGAIFGLVIVGLLSYIIFKALWIAVKACVTNLPDFLGKVFVSLATGVLAGFIGAGLFGLSFEMSGATGLALSAIAVMRG